MTIFTAPAKSNLITTDLIAVLCRLNHKLLYVKDKLDFIGKDDSIVTSAFVTAIQEEFQRANCSQD
jgi:hypothetical protein